MGRKKRNYTGDSVSARVITERIYEKRLIEIALTRFEWNGLPDNIYQGLLEKTLFYNGCGIFFKDDVLGHLFLRCNLTGNFDVNGIPVLRDAYADNGYHIRRNPSNSVIIFNNMLHDSDYETIRYFANKIAQIDRVIAVNSNAQKTPILIKCSQNELLTFKNLYAEYEGDTPVIFGDKSLNANNVSVLKTDAPYMCDKLYLLKMQYWNEALSFLGVTNSNFIKKERLVSAEAEIANGGTYASRCTGLAEREKACKQINEMFGLNLSVKFRHDINAEM